MTLPYIPAMTWFLIMVATMGGLAAIKLLCWHIVLKNPLIISHPLGSKAFRRGKFWMSAMILAALAFHFDVLEFVEQFCALMPAKSFVAHSLVIAPTCFCIFNESRHYQSLRDRV